MSKNNAVEKMITLKSSDGEEFIVTEVEAKLSETISNMIEVDCDHNAIPLPNITSKILAKVIEYCKKHVSEKDLADPFTAPWATSTSFWGKASNSKDRENWDAEFLNVDLDTIYGLISAANYLKIQELVELTCKNVADRMKGKTAEEISHHFGLVNDYTPEEEEEIRQQYGWAFEN